MTLDMSHHAVIVAAGTGSRAGGDRPKQFQPLAGRPVLRWSVETLVSSSITDIIVVIAPGDERLAEDAMEGLSGWRLALGQATRSLSVQAGLALIDGADDDIVLIHDAARPFLTRQHVEALVVALAAAPGAILALPVADTLTHPSSLGLTTLPREGLWRAQTPQAFRLGALRDAYARLVPGQEPTDDAQVMELAGLSVTIVPGDPMLMKLTYPEDFDMAERLALPRRLTRTGLGYDAHRLGSGNQVWLCGISISHDHGLVGHSDADVGLHAITDAILGALGEGDIGDHFPPSDERWRGVASSVFLRHAADLVARRSGRIIHVDVTLICEQPKIKPHRQSMREMIAQILQLPLSSVSVKATTTEGMGFTGRREGIAATAIATVETPD